MARTGEPSLPPGMKKEIMRYPSTHKHLPPMEGDEVEIHYVAKLKKGDVVFDSSRQRNQVLTYTVGKGQVIKGWDLGVQTMGKGEQARFTIPPELAYGEEGLQDRVPADSVVVYEVELLKCPMREDLFEDGGAIKREMSEGKGVRHPRTGDECQITHKVTVEGCGVAMSAQSAVYKVGSSNLGQIARVMDKALGTMKRGDEAMVKCQPQYAYGEGEGKYANKVAMMSLKLEEIFEVHDMSLGARDKTVLRKRIKEGSGGDKIMDTARVTVRVKSVTAGGESALVGERELSFTVGDGDVCDALEGPILDMRKGEEAIIRCESPEACAGGLLELPAGLETPVMIHIVVVSANKVSDKWDMNSAERLERGRSRKAAVGELFKRGRIRLAAHHYERVSDLFARADFFAEEERGEAVELRRTCDLNRAMCMLKMGNMETTVALCTAVLSDDVSNPKALFRRAKAQLELKDYNAAIADLSRLLEVEPNSTDGRQLLQKAKKMRKQTDERQSSVFSRMCDGLGKMPDRPDRRDDALVGMPDISADYARYSKLAAEAQASEAPAVADGAADSAAEQASREPGAGASA